jgi:hypothetical protein
MSVGVFMGAFIVEIIWARSYGTRNTKILNLSQIGIGKLMI